MTSGRLSCCGLAILTIGALYAQDTRGRILGNVTDSSRAAVPGAVLKAVNKATNIATTASTDGQGNYEILFLLPGTYTVTAEAKGFKKSVRDEIEVRISDRVRLDLVLQVGDVAESVTVTGESQLIESESASTGLVVDTRRILELPVNGGNVLVTELLTPGVANMAIANHGQSINAPQVASRITVSGVRSRNTEYTIDGTPAMSGNEASYVPPNDMVQEVKIETNSFDASIGRSIGGHVNMAMRSGTNALHGAVYEFHSNNHLNGIDLFQRQYLYNPATGPLNDAKRAEVNGTQSFNRYGATAGGPIYIPHVYDGRNRSFWIYGFEGTGFRGTDRSFGYFETVPDANERRGDFSRLLGLGPIYQIYDPATAVRIANGRTQRQPFPGNLIPQNRLTGPAQKLLNYWPEPNVAGTADGRNNYFRKVPSRDSFASHNVRFDHQFSPRHRTFLRYNHSQYNFFTSQTLPNISTGINWDRPDFGFGFDDVYAPSPHFMVNFRYGAMRHVITYEPLAKGFDLVAAGFAPALASQIDPLGVTFPQISVDQYSLMGRNYASGVYTNYQTAGGHITAIRSSHTLRFGGEFRLYRDHNYDFTYATPRIEFGTSWTRGPVDNSPAAPIGQGLASYLLGLPTGGQIRVSPSYAEQSTYSGFYLQDDWRAAPRLTINLGIRYEYEGPATERFNRSIRNFDFTATNPLDAVARARYAASPIPELAPSAFHALGGLTFAGVGGEPRALWEPDKNNIAPRFGLAYQFHRLTVLRAGYGVFYAPMGVDRTSVNQSGFTKSTTLVGSLTNGLDFAASLDNAFPNGFEKPLGAAGGLSTDAGQSVRYFYPHPSSALLQRWSIGIQRQAPRNIVFEINYVGSVGSDFGINRQMNPVPRQYLSTSPVRDQAAIDYLGARFRNPFSPDLQGTALSSTTMTRAQLLRPRPEFVGIMSSQPLGSTSYHSLQAVAQRRTSGGLTVQASYTWAKFLEATSYLNETDPVPERVVSSEDRPQRFAASGIYQVPVGKGQRFGPNLRGVAGHALGGWQVQALVEAQSGAPLGFGNAILYGNIHDIPLPGDQKRIGRWFNTGAGFERSPAKQLTQNIRTFPSRFNGVRGQGLYVWRASGMKYFQVTERVRLQFRTELLNAMNRSHFAAPNTAVTSTLFGSITATTGAPRTVWLSLKLLY